MFTKKEKINIYKRVGITKEAHIILENIKNYNNISMAKLTSALISESEKNGKLKELIEKII